MDYCDSCSTLIKSSVFNFFNDFPYFLVLCLELHVANIKFMTDST